MQNGPAPEGADGTNRDLLTPSGAELEPNPETSLLRGDDGARLLRSCPDRDELDVLGPDEPPTLDRERRGCSEPEDRPLRGRTRRQPENERGEQGDRGGGRCGRLRPVDETGRTSLWHPAKGGSRTRSLRVSREGRFRFLPFLVGDSAAGRRGVALLVRAVARAHERACEDRAEAERLALLAEASKLVGMHPTVDRRVPGGRL